MAIVQFVGLAILIFNVLTLSGQTTLNQNPAFGKKHSPLIFVHRNSKQIAPSAAEKDIVLPAAINVSSSLDQNDKAAAKALSQWVKKIEHYSMTQPPLNQFVRKWRGFGLLENSERPEAQNL